MSGVWGEEKAAARENFFGFFSLQKCEMASELLEKILSFPRLMWIGEGEVERVDFF